MNIENSICPEDTIQVLLPAYQIPDKSAVNKRTGEQQFTLSHGLKVYLLADSDKTMQIEGFFLLGPRGNINQIKPETLLLWQVTAEEFVDQMKVSWEETSQ